MGDRILHQALKHLVEKLEAEKGNPDYRQQYRLIIEFMQHRNYEIPEEFLKIYKAML